ncbi:hypothetical protein K8R43_01170 [archaeon]|nr:hypothetical protein [archaeon]
MKKRFALISLLFFTVACYGMSIEQVVEEDGSSFITAEVRKGYDSKFFDVDFICENFSQSEFFQRFDDPNCQETSSSIIITGSTDLTEDDGFFVSFEFVESIYELNSTGSYFNALVGERSLLWGAIPLNNATGSIGEYKALLPYKLELPGKITKVRNGESENFETKAKFDLVELYQKQRGIYVESKQTNWQFFSSLIIFLIMMVGILIVWMSYFYLKGKT